MGLCKLRTFCLTNCVIQLIFTSWRQVFDFLGYMWGPILANFFQIIFVIFGFFGVYQYRSKYIITYSVWCIFWCCWNVFVACFYWNIFGLEKDSDFLNLGTGSVSWWESNGPGCKPIFLANLSSLETGHWKPQRPDNVSGCFVFYHHLEAAQALLHLFMATAGLLSGVLITMSLMDEDGMCTNNEKQKKTELPSLYSIDYSLRQATDNIHDFNAHEIPVDPETRLSTPRPMTPRRVKRRSVNSKGLPLHKSNPTTSLPYSLKKQSSHVRSSQHRHRAPHQNPVTRLIDQQEKQTGSRLIGHTNLLYQQSSTNSLDHDCDRPSSARSVYSNYHGTRAFSYMHGHISPSTFIRHGPPAYSHHLLNKTETVI